MKLNYYFSSPFEAEKILLTHLIPLKTIFIPTLHFRQRHLQKFGRQNLLGTFIGRKKIAKKLSILT